MARRRIRGSFVLAGLGALAVTAFRAVLGGAADLAPLETALEGNDLVGVVRINWHALNAVFAGMSIALLAASVSSASAARAVALIATWVFGATTAVFMAVTAASTGSPFTYPPWVPLTVTTLLCAIAAWRAQVGERGRPDRI